jgi:hypothetical protein
MAFDENNLDENYVETKSWNAGSIVDYISNNIIQIVMLLSVFVIIYIVDRIVYFNSIIYGSTPIITAFKNVKLKRVKR